MPLNLFSVLDPFRTKNEILGQTFRFLFTTRTDNERSIIFNATLERLQLIQPTLNLSLNFNCLEHIFDDPEDKISLKYLCFFSVNNYTQIHIRLVFKLHDQICAVEDDFEIEDGMSCLRLLILRTELFDREPFIQMEISI